jgi:hypothetical protein
MMKTLFDPSAYHMMSSGIHLNIATQGILPSEGFFDIQHHSTSGRISAGDLLSNLLNAATDIQIIVFK